MAELSRGFRVAVRMAELSRGFRVDAAVILERADVAELDGYPATLGSTPSAAQQRPHPAQQKVGEAKSGAPG
jgi:hypothetical protein